MSAKRVNEMLHKIAPSMTRISELMIESEEMEFQAPPGSSARTSDDLMSDPTGETVVNERRICVVEARAEALRLMMHLESEMRTVAVQLSKAVNGWLGE
jgi:hypothetical protein